MPRNYPIHVIPPPPGVPPRITCHALSRPLKTHLNPYVVRVEARDRPLCHALSRCHGCTVPYLYNRDKP
jgi:hypothetical protein